MHFWGAFLPVRWWKGRRVFVTMINKEGFAWIWEKYCKGKKERQYDTETAGGKIAGGKTDRFQVGSRNDNAYGAGADEAG